MPEQRGWYWPSAVVILLCIASCNAPRNNPLDSQNPDAVFGVLTGTVQTVSLPRSNLADVSVVKNGNLIGKTNSSGTFTINYVVPENGWIYFQKTGYISDSLYLNWSGKKTLDVEIYLYQNLSIDSVGIYASVKNLTPPESYLSISARVIDNDNYINQDSVFVECSDLNYRGRLTYANKLYSRTMDVVDLGITSLDEALWLTFTIKAKDKSNRLYELGSTQLKRLLTNKVAIVRPLQNEVVAASPTLEWVEYSATFKYTEKVEIYSVQDGFLTGPIWQKDQLPLGSTSITVDKTLLPGQYAWLVWVIDNFSNRVSSSPATFIVQ